jgi:hypothetical protein
VTVRSVGSSAPTGRLIQFVHVIALGLLFGLPSVVQAQMFSYGGTVRRSVQTLSFVTHFIDFEYNGRGDPVQTLDFSEPAYGVMYNRPSFAGAIVWGSSSREPGAEGGNLNIVDATATFWGNVIRSNPGGSSQFGIPIVIHSGYRSVNPVLSSSPNDQFAYSSLGMGAGATFHSELASRFWFDIRVWPIMSMSFRSFEGFAGSTFLVDSDAQFHVIDLFGSMGLSVGYGYRYQVWNNKESGLPGGIIRADQFDYKSSQHMVRAGISW